VVASSGGLRVDAEHTARLWSALSHVVRNAIDHGIEPPERRIALGKSHRARIELSTAQVAGAWTVTVSDDGCGIDWARLEAKAAEIGWNRRDRAGLTELLFRDGVSTRDAATEHSGRGVGLSALKEAAETLGAAIALDSEPGRGTHVTVTIPDLLSHPHEPLAARARARRTSMIPRMAAVTDGETAGRPTSQTTSADPG
jgi:two-component system chemotaxis sensor kinase CheA